MRQIVLDTETTGVSTSNGDRIIEVGCVELINRRFTGNVFHQYINPDREVSQGAFQVHGISNEFLEDKPRFAQISESLKAFLEGAELIIHNAPFDVGFLEYEFELLEDSWKHLEDYCTILDTLKMARKRHPGQKNNLDALCKRYGIDNTRRDKHGALLDAEILAELYLAMTGGQTKMALDVGEQKKTGKKIEQVSVPYVDLPVIKANERELKAHAQILQSLRDNGECLWDSLTERNVE